MRVALRHRESGRLRLVPTGFSWSILLGAGFLGLPLFFRGLALWGTLMVALWSVQLALPYSGLADRDTLDTLLNLAIAGLCLYLGFHGNALAARHLFACGYEFADPAQPEAREAAARWGV